MSALFWRALYRENPESLITDTVNQETLIFTIRMFVFPLGFVSVDLFYIRFRWLEPGYFSPGFAGVFFPAGIGIIFELQEKTKTCELGVKFADEFQVRPPAGIRFFQRKGKIAGKVLTTQLKKRGAVKIFIPLTEYCFRELR